MYAVPMETLSELEGGSDDFNFYDRDEGAFQVDIPHEALHYSNPTNGAPRGNVSMVTPHESLHYSTNPTNGASHGDISMVTAVAEEEEEESDDSCERLPTKSESHLTASEHPITFSPQSPRTETPIVLSPRQAEQTPHPVYCICKDPVWDSAMIECHGCHKHFHGNCVGISRQKASLLKHFYCSLCIDRDPELVTEFDTKEAREAKGEREAKGDREAKGERETKGDREAKGERETTVTERKSGTVQKEGKKLKAKRHNRR